MSREEFDELAEQVRVVEAQIRALRAGNADFRGEFARVHEEMAGLRGDVRGEFARVHERLDEHSARLDAHFEFHQTHVLGLNMLTDTVREIDATMREHSATLNEHTATLNEHTATLNEHTATLNEHTATLNEHTATLNEHTATLQEHGEMLREILRRLEAA